MRAGPIPRHRRVAMVERAKHTFPNGCIVTGGPVYWRDKWREQQDEIERLCVLLQAHHTHHLQKGAIGLPDGDGGWIEIDNGAEYSDSNLYERTADALSDEIGQAPRELIAKALEQAKR